MSDNELIEKVVATDTALADAKGGFLRRDLANRFIDYVYDATVLGGQVRVERIRENTTELTRIAVGERLLRVATEAVDDGVNVGAAFSKISVSTTKFRLDWELSTEALEDGREGPDLEDHIARLMANQVGNDLEDYAINADSALTTDPALKAFDGWSKRARTTGHIVDAGGAVVSRGTFSKALKAMPRKHMANRAGLKFFTGSNVLQDFLDAEQALALEHNTTGTVPANGNAVLGAPSSGSARIYGQTVQEVPLFDENKTGDYSGGTASQAIHSEIWLTNPQNLIWAMKREVQVYRTFQPKKDAIEYVLYCRVGTAIENGDAFVVVKNVKVI